MDGELVAKVARGDRRAFSTLMLRHGAAVYRYSWALADSPHQVEDLVQETFLVFWSKRRGVSVAGDSLLPWLLTTCRFIAFNANRRERQRRSGPLDEIRSFASPATAAAEQLQWVMDEIATFSEVDRELFKLCLLEGWSYVEAAVKLDLSPAAARKRVQRARVRLVEARTNGLEGEGQ